MVLDEYERDPLVQSSLPTSFDIVGRNNLLDAFTHTFGRNWMTLDEV